MLNRGESGGLNVQIIDQGYVISKTTHVGLYNPFRPAFFFFLAGQKKLN